MTASKCVSSGHPGRRPRWVQELRPWAFRNPLAKPHPAFSSLPAASVALGSLSVSEPESGSFQEACSPRRCLFSSLRSGELPRAWPLCSQCRGLESERWPWPAGRGAAGGLQAALPVCHDLWEFVVLGYKTHQSLWSKSGVRGPALGMRGRGSNQTGAALVPPGSPPLPGFSYDYWTLRLFPVLPTSELPWENGFPGPPQAAVPWGGRWVAGGGQRGWADSRMPPPGSWLAAGLCWWKAGPRAPTPRNLLRLQDLRAGRSADGPAPGQ